MNVLTHITHKKVKEKKNNTTEGLSIPSQGLFSVKEQILWSESAKLVRFVFPIYS